MRLKCVTTASFATPGLQPIDLELIYRASIRNNARDGITGLLLFNGAVFVQTIEGPPDAVDRLLMRQAVDGRHCEMIVRDERKLWLRIFAAWSMGYMRLDGGWVEGQFDIVEALSREMPAEIHDLLMELAQTLPLG